MTAALRYVLVGRDPVAEPDLLRWARWFETADRTVAVTGNDDVAVSTVFLGLDHGFGGGPPVLFETMVFGGRFDGACERYATWDEAEAGHAELAAAAFGLVKPEG